MFCSLTFSHSIYVPKEAPLLSIFMRKAAPESNAGVVFLWILGNRDLIRY